MSPPIHPHNGLPPLRLAETHGAPSNVPTNSQRWVPPCRYWITASHADMPFVTLGGSQWFCCWRYEINSGNCASRDRLISGYDGVVHKSVSHFDDGVFRVGQTPNEPAGTCKNNSKERSAEVPSWSSQSLCNKHKLSLDACISKNERTAGKSARLALSFKTFSSIPGIYSIPLWICSRSLSSYRTEHWDSKSEYNLKNFTDLENCLWFEPSHYIAQLKYELHVRNFDHS